MSDVIKEGTGGEFCGLSILVCKDFSLSDHAPECELRRISTTAICTAEAMNPGRKVVFVCTCKSVPVAGFEAAA